MIALYLLWVIPAAVVAFVIYEICRGDHAMQGHPMNGPR